VAYAEGLARENPLVKAAEFAARRPASGGLAQLESSAVPGPQPSRTPAPTLGHGPVPEPYEYLLVSADGLILEGTGTNFWSMRDGVVYTAGEGVLEGITRKILLALIREEGIPLRLDAVRMDEVPGLDEAALSGSSRAFLPIVDIAGQVVGDGRPGPLSRRILAAYNAYLVRNIRKAGV
jgi:hypothetical protein